MTLNVGIAGFGFMGRMHFDVYANHPEAEVTHVFAGKGKEPLKEEEAAEGNIEGESEQNIDLSNVTLVETFEELCESDVNVIDICMPTFLHAEYAVKSLVKGKHTFLEKPMGLNTEEIDTILAALEESGCILQVGHCLRFWPEYEALKRIVDTGEYGDIRAASFRRMSPFPEWSVDSWMKDSAKSGGAALDLHIHDTDFINYLFGRPISVESFGASLVTDGVDHILTRYNYGDGKVVTAEGGWMGMSGFPFSMGFTVMCEEASIEFRDEGVSVYTKNGEVIIPELSSGDGWMREIDYFITCIIENKKPEIVTPSQAREAVEIVCAEIESVKNGKEVVL